MQAVHQSDRRMIPVSDVARKLGIHPRSVFRHADHGVMPQSVKIGASRRWDEAEIDAWIAAGCPPYAQGGVR